MGPKELEGLARVSGRHWFYRGKRRVIWYWLRRVGALAGRPLLVDCGAGTGEFAVEATRHCRVMGLDDSDWAVNRLEGLLGSGNARKATVTALPIDDGAADIVTALDVIEHVADDRAAVAEFHRVLRPGGWLAVTVPACPFLWSSWDEVLGHHRRYTHRTLKTLLEDGGFQPARLAYINVPAFPAMVAARILRRWAGEPSGWRFEDWIPPGPINALLEELFVWTACMPHVRFPAGASLLAIARQQVPGISPKAWPR